MSALQAAGHGLRRVELGNSARVVITTAALVGAAIGGGLLIRDHSGLAAGVPALCVLALVVSRFPATSVIALFAVTGAYGTLVAYLPVPLAMVDAVLAALWVAALWTLVIKRRARPLALWPGLVALGAYVFVTAFQVLTGPAGLVGVSSFIDSAWYMLAFFLIAYAAWGPRTDERILRGVLLVALGVGAYATFRWIVGPSARELAIASSPYNLVDTHLRLFGSLPTGLELGLWTGLLVPFSCAFALMWKGPLRLVAIGAAALCTVALVGSEVRTSLVGAVAGVGLVLVLYHAARAFPGVRLGVTALALLSVLGLGTAMFVFSDAGSKGSQERFGRIFHPTRDPAFEARLDMWRTAVGKLDQRPLGHGLGTGGQTAQRAAQFGGDIGVLTVDNGYLKVAWEQGLLVLGLFVVALALLLWGLAYRAVLTVDRHAAALGIAACGALASYVVMLFFLGLFVRGLGALAVWLLIGLGARPFVFAKRAKTDAV